MAFKVTPQGTIKLAKLVGDEIFSSTTIGIAAGLVGEFVAEKALFSSLRSVFGDSGQGLSDRERVNRQLARAGLVVLGGIITVLGRQEAEKAFGIGMMGEGIISLLKGFGVQFS